MCDLTKVNDDLEENIVQLEEDGLEMSKMAHARENKIRKELKEYQEERTVTRKTLENVEEELK